MEEANGCFMQLLPHQCKKRNENASSAIQRSTLVALQKQLELSAVELNNTVRQPKHQFSHQASTIITLSSNDFPSPQYH